MSLLRLLRLRWSPRERVRVFGNRWFGLVANGSRQGISWSLNFLGATFNSRGTYSINGPSILDFRGRWKDTPTGNRGGNRGGNPAGNRTGNPGRRRRRESAGTPRQSRTHVDTCAAVDLEGWPCTLDAGHTSPHRPPVGSGRASWRDVADTSRPWWRR